MKGILLLFSVFFLITGINCTGNNYPEPPVGVGSRYPNPHATEGGDIFMTWSEPMEGENIKLLFSEFSNGIWSQPRTVITGARFFVNWADFPSVYYKNGDTLAIHWLQKSQSGTYDYDINLAVTTDRGYSWSAPIKPHRDGTFSEHGFVSFFTGLDNKLGLVWLDGRNMAVAGDQSEHGNMALYSTTLNSHLKLEDELLLDNRVCECCPTAAIETNHGVIVAYRDRSDNEIRNINIIRFIDGHWTDPYPVHDDNWQISGCPVNGPALASDGQSVAVAWFTAPGNDPQVNVAFSNDAGSSFNEPLRVDEGQPIGRVDLEWVGNETVLVSWIEVNEEETELLIKKVTMNGKVGPPVVVSSINPGRGSGYPRMALGKDAVLFLWSNPGETYFVESKWIAFSKLYL